MRRPSVEALPETLAACAVEIAERLVSAGHAGWIVGGAVRDLALGVEPKDVDMATDLRPEQIEALFEHAVSVGRAFGTVLVRSHGHSVAVTTFRADGAYSDGRRPDEVRFATSLEVDARRRDFTCNALFLDPATDALEDPQGGLTDLEAGVLRCVGDPGARFAEDGLRLLRMARFAAARDLSIDPPTLAAARLRRDRLGSVSPERIYAELELLCTGPGASRGLAILAQTGVLEGAVGESGGACWARRRVALERLPEGTPFPVWLAALLGSDGAALARLRPPRAVRERVEGLWALGRELAELDPGDRSARVRLVRRAEWGELVLLERARGGGEALDELVAFAGSLGEAQRFPASLVGSADLRRLGVPRGPAWGRLLREVEDLQLAGDLGGREEALAWLRRRAAELGQEGGNARRRR